MNKQSEGNIGGRIDPPILKGSFKGYLRIYVWVGVNRPPIFLWGNWIILEKSLKGEKILKGWFFGEWSEKEVFI